MKLLFALIIAASLYAQPSLTTVSSPVGNADGTPFTGKITIVAQAIQSGTVSVRSAPILPTIVAGVLTVQLAANDATYPTGAPYYVVYQPTRGTPYSENWGVMQGGPYTILQVLKPSAQVAASINTLLNGTVDPTNLQGNNGDMFLNITTQCLWGPKSHAVWPISPPCVSIKGIQGIQGVIGVTGPPVTFRGAWLIGTAYVTGDSVSFGGSSYIALSGNTGLQPDTNPGTWSLLAQKGNTGAGGSAGAAATVAVGTTSTGAAAVTNSGTSSAAVLNFTVPQGATGPPVTFRGAWLIGTAYVTGDSVSLAGSSYIALSGNTGLEPDTNPGSWGILAQAGAMGPTSTVPGPAGAASTVPGPIGPASTVPGPAGPTPSGAGNLSLLTPDGTSGTAALRALRASDIQPAGLLGNSTTGNASTSTVAAHAGTADLASVATLATTFVCTGCTVGLPICWNGSGPTTSCGGVDTLFDSFTGLFDSVSDALFDSSTH